MKDSLNFRDDETRESESNWHMGISTPSFDTVESKAALQQRNLQILLQKETPSEREIIPATLYEQLAFYCAVIASPSKTHLIPMQQIFFNKFLWFYIFNVFCKSLPTTYVYIFLSSYAAEDHYFVPKMVPLFYGYIWYSIFSASIVINNYSPLIFLLWDYVVCGVLYKNPWNRCDTDYIFENITIKCYNISEFSKIMASDNIIYPNYWYFTDINSTEYFQMAPVIFTRSRVFLDPWLLQGFVFVGSCLFYRQLFKKHIWKILFWSQGALILIYFGVFCHFLVYYLGYGFETKITFENELLDKLANELWLGDFDLLAESMACPPLVHILSARSTKKRKPSRDSTIIIVSCAVYYIFRGVIDNLLTKYCESLIGVRFMVTTLPSLSSFYLWPIYFSYFYLGDYFSIVFFALNGTVELLIMAIKLYCLIEAMSCEWRWMKPWITAALMSIMFIIYNSPITSDDHRFMITVYSTALTTLVESIIMFWIYPIGRMVDDITFHCGVPPSALRIWNISLVPAFYMFKVIIMIRVTSRIMHMQGVDDKTPFYLLFLQLVPFIIGAFYAIYNIMFKKKKSWKQLFVPVPEWGPKDPAIRRLRHQYDSRQYIGSQAPRDLSRYLIAKTELTTYRLDIQYDGLYRQRIPTDLKFEDEKKND